MNERDSVPADTESRCQKIFVAIELSKAKWIVVIRAPHVDKSSLFEVVGGDVDRLLVLIERARKAAVAQGFKVSPKSAPATKPDMMASGCIAFLDHKVCATACSIPPVSR